MAESKTSGGALSTRVMSAWACGLLLCLCVTSPRAALAVADGTAAAVGQNQVQVIDEAHASPVPGSVVLRYPDVVPGSVTVALACSQPPYQRIRLEDLAHYAVVKILKAFVVRLLALPEVPPGCLPPGTPTTYPFVVSYRFSAACVGDCNGDGSVTIDELVAGLSLALGGRAVDTCPRFDPNGDGRATINELVTAVGNAEYGCGIPPPPPTSTPTLTPTQTRTPSPTPSPTWTQTPGAGSLNGQWGGTWQKNTSTRGLLSAMITQNASALTGTMVFSDTRCFSSGSLSGTITNGHWTASVGMMGGTQIALSGTAAGDDMTGTYTVTGGDCTGDTGTVTLARPATLINVTGSWSGTWLSITEIGGLFGSVTASLQQSGTTVTGTVSFEWHLCPINGTVSGTQIGNIWSGSMSADGVQVLLSGKTTDTLLNGNYAVFGGACDGDRGTIQMTR